MANSPQAIKRVRQAAKHRLLNASQRSAMRTALKKTLKAIADKNKEEALAAFKSAQTMTDRLARKNLIHPNKAARLKSRLNARLKALG